MQSITDIPRCNHIKNNGVQCNSPAIARKKFCYLHCTWRKSAAATSGSRVEGAAGPESAAGANLRAAARALPLLEDANAIQMALMQVMRLILTRQIDDKAARLLLSALRTASSNLKHMTVEPDWKKVVVNPAAVRYSPLDRSAEPPEELARENELLFQRMQTGPADPETAGNTGQKRLPCATAEASLATVMRSRHALPTSPEDWDELKEKDSSAWLMAMAALTYPREMWQEIREHPEKFSAEEQ
jgi:hypothetical protein